MPNLVRTMGARTPPCSDVVGRPPTLIFCNTHGSRSGAPEERFPSYPDVVGWAWRAGVLNAEEAARLQRLATRQPTGALAVWERALKLRSALQGLFTAIALGKRVRPAWLEALDEA